MYNKCCTFVLIIVFIFFHCHGIILQRKSYPALIGSSLTSKWFESVNNDQYDFNRLSATITWRLMTGDDANSTLQDQGAALGAAKTAWKNAMCDLGAMIKHPTAEEKRMFLLFCRGPRYSPDQARELSKLMDNMSEAYSSAEVCVPVDSWPVNDLQIKSNDGKVCLKGEPDLENLMTRQDLSSEQLLWIWKSWHDNVGPQIRQFYPRLVTVLNQAAIYNGYKDTGEVWREELEIPNLEKTVNILYNEIQPIYVMLHAVVRHALFKKYGSNVVNPTGPIPAHLLGNMWGQDWSALINLLIPKEQNLNLDDHIKQKNWTVTNMVEIAEDMYVSLGLPKMTDKFWKYSKFERNEKNASLCHGTAANMFDEDDFRILLCATLNMGDFYVIHHEMGHIEYYMAYKNQPTIFQDGANSAFQESIGDSIMTGVMVPQHLHRLGIISDKQLLNKNMDHVLLLQQALSKIPQIPYALLIDQYRWNIFKGKITPGYYNEMFWQMNTILRGVSPPQTRSEYYFDAGAKFHVPDNTPYIRYFLSAILQMQLFKGMCEITIYGKVTEFKDVNVPFPLHRCDIYGSKNAGIKLKNMMALGSSEHWSTFLNTLTGKNYITVKPLLEYYKPIYEWLQNYVVNNNIPVGW